MQRCYKAEKDYRRGRVSGGHQSVTSVLHLCRNNSGVTSVTLVKYACDRNVMEV